jgi:kynureninase
MMFTTYQGDCTMLTREHCLAADASDKLASLRQQFRLPEHVIYLDGNSLGVLPTVPKNAACKCCAGNGVKG